MQTLSGINGSVWPPAGQPQRVHLQIVPDKKLVGLVAGLAHCKALPVACQPELMIK